MSQHDNLCQVAERVLDEARKHKLDQAEVSLHQGTGVSVTARLGDLESVEKYNDSQVAVTVYKDHKTGSASSADMTEQGIKETVAAAASIARYTSADDCFGLAETELMATEFVDLQLFHPWQLNTKDMAELALQCEQAALQFDKRITNSEGANVNSYSGSATYANSHGFLHQTQGSRHGLNCTVIGTSGESMQRDYWYDSQCDPQLLEQVQSVGETAASRTIRRLNARKITSCEVPVLFEPTLAKSLIGHVIGGIQGGAIYKKASFLLDKVNQQILPEFITIAENPRRVGGLGSANYDNEGVATPDYWAIVDNGVLQNYVLASYTARKLGLKTTANAGGVRNLTVSDTGQSFEQLLKQMDKGLLVTELIGSGVNMVTGDYSRGAAGFWVEGGQIKHPVEEITIASNITNMLQNIVAVGSDTDKRGNSHCGSILIDNMTIAGS